MQAGCLHLPSIDLSGISVAGGLRAGAAAQKYCAVLDGASLMIVRALVHRNHERVDVSTLCTSTIAVHTKGTLTLDRAARRWQTRR
jgi:hypothetical protein